MKYIPLLQEERFQSMVAVPILSRSNETLGVIVLHTEAPREFTEETLKLLVHIASLVSGAIENAQLYQRERRRVDTLTRLSGLGGEVAAASDADDLGLILAHGFAPAAGRRVLPGLSPGPRRRRPAAAALRSGRCRLAADGLRRGLPDRRARWPRLRADRAQPVARPGRRRPAADAADGGRRAPRAAVRGLAAAAQVQRRGHGARSRDRPHRRGRDQAR